MSLDKIAELRLMIINLEEEVMKTIDDGATLEEAGNMLLQLNLQLLCLLDQMLFQQLKELLGQLEH